MNYIVGYSSNIGNKKEVNQDSSIVQIAKSPHGRIALFVVCDGMGGLSDGELASATVIRGLNNWFNEEIPTLDFSGLTAEDICININNVIEVLNNKILEYGKKNRAPLGTTLTLMLVVDTNYYICQVGDSRAYRLTKQLNQLTKDQTLVAREVERGNLTEEEAKRDKRRNILLQCIGAKKEIEPEFLAGKLAYNETFLICSDGFYRKLKDSEITEIASNKLLTTSKALTNKAEELIEIVKSRKEVDNITAIIIKTIE
ncbi:MAG: serine/threonine-protein phosphatase [Clostridium sp.]